MAVAWEAVSGVYGSASSPLWSCAQVLSISLSLVRRSESDTGTLESSMLLEASQRRLESEGLGGLYMLFKERSQIKVGFIEL